MTDNLILLHGALGSSRQLGALKKVLSERFNVYDLDFEGHGGIPTGKDFSIDLFANNLSDFVQRNHIQKANVFGYSMGGYVAMHFAREKRDTIHKIVTLGTKFDWTSEFAAEQVKQLDPQKIEEKVPRFAQMLRDMHYPSDWKEVVEKTAKMMQELGGIKDEDIRRIRHPVLIGVGDSDHMVSREESEKVARLLPNGKLRVIQGFQHPVEKVNTETLAGIITEFIS